MDILRYLPEELVNEIADYHDYDKYCKKPHMEVFQNVLKDIFDMDCFMSPISPNIALQCWGSGLKRLTELSDGIWEIETWEDHIIENNDYIEDIYGVLNILVTE